MLLREEFLELRKRLLEIALLSPRDLRAWVELARHDMRRGRPGGAVCLAHIILPHALEVELVELICRPDVSLEVSDSWPAAVDAGFLSLYVWGVPLASVGRVLFPLRLSSFYGKK